MGDGSQREREREVGGSPTYSTDGNLMETGWKRLQIQSYSDTQNSLCVFLSQVIQGGPKYQVPGTCLPRGSVIPRLSEIDAALSLTSLLELHILPCAHMAFERARASLGSGCRFSPFGARTSSSSTRIYAWLINDASPIKHLFWMPHRPTDDTALCEVQQ